MIKEKQHYLYVLVPENGSNFKIGISCGLMERFKGLSVKPDLKNSRIYTSDRLSIINLERALHAALFPWNAPWEEGAKAGKTEWFTRDILDRALQHIDFLSELWGGTITPINNVELLKRPVEPRVGKFRECMDITEHITFVADNRYDPIKNIKITSSCQQRVKSDPLTVTTNGLILIHLVYSGLASAITPAFRFCFSR